jgi:hypothetical protein
VHDRPKWIVVVYRNRATLSPKRVKYLCLFDVAEKAVTIQYVLRNGRIKKYLSLEVIYSLLVRKCVEFFVGNRSLGHE